MHTTTAHTAHTSAATLNQFTTNSDFVDFMEQGSTPALHVLGRTIKESIAAFPHNVRCNAKALHQHWLTMLREELSAR
jgi:hypothetical protein